MTGCLRELTSISGAYLRGKSMGSSTAGIDQAAAYREWYVNVSAAILSCPWSSIINSINFPRLVDPPLVNSKSACAEARGSDC